MSEAAEAADRPAVISLAEVERRVALTRGSGRLSIQEQLDWGEVLLASGDHASARFLVQSAFIRQGFSPQLERARTGLFTAIGLEQAPCALPAPGKPQGNTVDIAIAELRAFARAHGERIVASLLGSAPRRDDKPGLHPTASLARGASLPSSRGVAELVQQIFSWLRSVPSEQHDDAGVAAIDALRGPEKDPLRWMAAGLAGAAPTMLASAIAIQETRAFLRSHSDLLLPRLGSPALFRAAAAFDSTGLGPYFGNVGQIIRSSANLFELAAIASEAADTAHASSAEEVWLALLSRGLSGWLRFDVVDELGDRNASLALTLILERTVAVAADDIDRSLVARIRDAALDNLNYELASSAQQELVNLSHNDMLERRIMGAIQASAGRVAAADQLLSACLKDNPGDQRLRQEVEANQERRYAPFALIKGFGSPRDRQLKRIGARAAARKTAREVGKPIVGVQL